MMLVILHAWQLSQFLEQEFLFPRSTYQVEFGGPPFFDVSVMSLYLCYFTTAKHLLHDALLQSLQLWQFCLLFHNHSCSGFNSEATTSWFANLIIIVYLCFK